MVEVFQSLVNANRKYNLNKNLISECKVEFDELQDKLKSQIKKDKRINVFMSNTNFKETNPISIDELERLLKAQRMTS